MVGIYLGSYVFILEADYDPKNTLTQDTSSTSEEFYAIFNEDGTYDIYCNDLFIENTVSLDYYPPSMTIYAK